MTDGKGGSVAATLGFTVDAVNDAPTAIALSNSAIAENASNGTVVGTLSTTDADNASGFTYQLLDDAGGAFSLNKATGAIFVSNGNLLNYEAVRDVMIDVQSTDAAGAVVHQQIAIHLTNVFENQSFCRHHGGGRVHRRFG